MFAKKSTFAAIARRKVNLTGENEIDYRIDGVQNGIYLLTAEEMDLTKGRRNTIIVKTVVNLLDRVAAIKVNPALYESGVVSAPVWLEPEDPGQIYITVSPKKDIQLGELDYICKIILEGVS